MLISSRSFRTLVVLALAAVSLAAFTACGGSKSDDATATTAPSATQSSGSGSSSPTATPRATATASSTATPGLGNIFADSCAAIGLISGLPGGISGSSVTDTPSSDFARDAADYFFPIIKSALGDGEPGCFLEVDTDGELGIWAAYELDDDPPADGSTRLKNELVDNGIADDDVSSFSSNFGGTTFAGVNLTNVAALGRYYMSDVAIFISGRSAVLVINQYDSGDDASPTATPSGNSSPDPTATPGTELQPTVVASGLAGTIDSLVRPALQETLGVSLNLTGEFSSSSGGSSTVFLTYEGNGAFSPGSETDIQAALEKLGATVDATMNFDGNAMVTFSGLAVANQTAEGTVVTDGTNLTVTIVLE